MFTTLADLTPTPGPDRRCRYVKVNGARCRAHAKPTSDLCVDHHFKKTYSRGRVRPNPPATFNTVPLVRFAWAEDHDAILFNCNQIALALVHDTINARQAGALNALMYTAQRSLRQKFLHERFEARERERAAQSAGPGASSRPSSGLSGHPGASDDPRSEDFVTDYVLDTDGMPLALPDEPVPPSQPESTPSDSAPSEASPSSSSQTVPENTEGAPCKPAVGSSENSCALADPLPALTLDEPIPPPALAGAPTNPGENEKEKDPAWIARQREDILYLRQYFKDDPKMLAEIETYPAARYAPIPKYEPEAPIVTLPTLTACADDGPVSAQQSCAAGRRRKPQPPLSEAEQCEASRREPAPSEGRACEASRMEPALSEAEQCEASRAAILRSRTTEKATAFRPWNRRLQKEGASAPDRLNHPEPEDRIPCLLYYLRTTPLFATHTRKGPRKCPVSHT